MSKEVIVKVEKKDKLAIIENRMRNLARECYNQELNLKVFEACNEKEQSITATKFNIERCKKSYSVLETELKLVQALKE